MLPKSPFPASAAQSAASDDASRRSGRYRVFVKTGERDEGGHTVTEFAYVEVSEAQARAYANGDPNWRAAKCDPWYSRLWHRLRG